MVVLVVWLGGRSFGKHEAAVSEPPSPPGTFRATAQQLKTLTIEPVGMHGFVSEELTEGKIAVNGDRATPVVLALFGPRDPRDRRTGRYGQKGRAARDDRGLGVRPGAERSRHGGRAAQARAHQRDPQARAVRGQGRQPARLAAGAGGSDRGRDRAALGAQSAEDPGQIRCANRRAGSGSHASIPSATISRADRGRGGGSPGRARASICRRAAARRYSPSPIPRACGCWPTCAKPTRARCDLGQPMEVHVPAYPKRAFEARVTYVAALVDPVDASPAGAGRNRQPRSGAEAGNVREFSHSNQRCVAVSRRYRRPRSSTRAMRRTCGWSQGDGLARLPRHTHRAQQRRIGRGARGPEAGRAHRHQGRPVHRSGGGARLLHERHRHLRAAAARADRRAAGDDAGRRRRRAFSRSTSRPIPIRCRRWSMSSRRAPGSPPRRSSATSRSRSKFRWPASPTCRRSAPSRCSGCPTSRCNSPTISPTTKPSNG